MFLWTRKENKILNIGALLLPKGHMASSKYHKVVSFQARISLLKQLFSVEITKTH
jgi:hypothetical protein